jgi:putative peptidoglycan lipid II flippase
MLGVILSAGLISLLTVLANLLGFIRELLFARAFGITNEADSFVAAFSIVATCYLVLAGGALQGAFMPLYQQAVVRNESSLARGLWLTGLAVVFVFSSVLSMLFYFGSDVIVSWVVPGFNYETQLLTVEMVKLLLPLIMLCSFGALFQSILHAHKVFSLPAFIPIGNNLVLILVILTLVPLFGVASLGYGSVLGGALWLILIPFVLHKVRKSNASLGFDKLKDLFSALWPLIVLLAVDQIAGLIQKTLVSDLDVGSIAVLNYAARLHGLPVGIFAVAISAAIFPALVEVIAHGNKKMLEEKFSFGIELVCFFLMPTAVFLIVESESFVRVLLERGSFTSEATIRTSRALELYSIGMLSQGLIVYLNRVYFALGDTKTPMLIGIITAGFHVLFCWLAVIKFGYVGIAIGTSFYAIVYSFFLIWRLRRLIQKPFNLIIKGIWRTLAASSVMCVFAILINYFYFDAQIVLKIFIYSACYLVSCIIFNVTIVRVLGYHIKKFL